MTERDLYTNQLIRSPNQSFVFNVFFCFSPFSLILPSCVLFSTKFFFPSTLRPSWFLQEESFQFTSIFFFLRGYSSVYFKSCLSCHLSVLPSFAVFLSPRFLYLSILSVYLYTSLLACRSTCFHIYLF